MQKYYLKNENGALVEQETAHKMIFKINELEQEELLNLFLILNERYIEQIHIIGRNHNFIAKFYPSVEEKNDRIYLYWKDYSKRNCSAYLSFEKRKKIKGDRVKRHKRLGYTRSSFSKAFKAELEMVMFYEYLFNQIRKRSHFLNKVKYYSNLADQVDLSEHYDILEEYCKFDNI